MLNVDTYFVLVTDMYVDCSGSNTSLCESSSSAPPVCDDIYAATACVFLSTDSESDQSISKSNENRIAVRICIIVYVLLY